jgi:hypothetical protein
VSGGVDGRVERLPAPPRLSLLYAGTVVSAPLRLLTRGGGEPALPPVTLALDGVTVDPDRLAAYDRVCGFALGGALPVTYPHVLAFGLHVALMARRGFPFPVPGLVHVRNVVTQHRAIRADEPLSIRVHAERLAAHPRGATVDLVTGVEADGSPVWQGRSTYLARGGAAPDPSSSPSSELATEPPAEAFAAAALPLLAELRVGGDTGRRYAAVSGDVNPMHLSWLAARALGFRGALAHGMWAKARTLAAVESRLPDAVTVDVSFRSPLVLPARARLLGEQVGDGWRLALVPSGGGKPHLTATTRPAGAVSSAGRAG